MICGDYGPTEEGVDKCPKCGRPRQRFAREIPEETTREMIEREKRGRVPQEYKNNPWSLKKFKDANGHRWSDRMKDYAETLDKIFQIYKKGSLPRGSGFFCSPSTYAKITWAMSCMQEAEDHGFTVAPMLSTLEANRLVVLSGQKSFDYKICGVTYDEYIESDVLFITVTKTVYRKAASAVIREIVDARSRRGLSTMVLSEFGTKEISDWDDTGMFDRALGSLLGDNPRKSLDRLEFVEVLGF